MPSLPTLDLHKTELQGDVLESPGQLSGIKEEVRFAACDLVCEWAQKVLKRQFDSVEDLARFLIDSHYISNKSLAALTIVTGTAAEVKTPQPVSAFVPTGEAHSFQPQVTNLSSPSIDAKQQLQKKIQRKQQEQKLLSPSPGEGQVKRDEDGVPGESPAPQSPPPTIGIVVTAVPSPITVQRSRQLMSPSPLGTVENKVLPINIQMVTQPVQPVKQSPRTLQNILPSPAGERTARQRYAQILPKPMSTTAITLHSPSTMIIANSPIKTVMTTCHVSPVSLVKMTAISLPANSGSGNTTTSLSSAGVRSASAGISCNAVEDNSFNHAIRSASAVPILAPEARPGQATSNHSIDVEMEVEAIHKNSQMQNSGGVVLVPGEMKNRTAGAVQRAASVPIPHTKGFLGLEDISATKCNENPFSSTNATAVAVSSNTSDSNTSTLHLAPSPRNTSTVSLMDTGGSSLSGENSNATPAMAQSLRKRCGLSLDPSPVKKLLMSQQTAEGAAAIGYGRKAAGYGFRPGSLSRPESAPAIPEVEIQMNSVVTTQIHTLGTSSFRTSGFYSVAKTQNSIARKNTATVMETSSTISHALMQQQHGHTPGSMHAIPDNPILQEQPGHGTLSNPTTGNMEGARHQLFTQSNSATEPPQFLSQPSSCSQMPMQTDVDFFSFDDDVTQDSIVEELVQMEEQMKLNRLMERGNCVSLHGNQAVQQDNFMSTNQTVAAFYHPTHNSNIPVHTPTPTPTPTPTSEMMGGNQGLTGESPCSRMASTTPVDSALGSSRHTPVGTPHSGCSSTVPPSPVECRNPFAFTPINSITGFHEGSTVSSSPVKPMQRPMATHPDKTRLEWMNTSYNNNSVSLNRSNNGIGILPSYQGLMDDHFQKPHAFAVPHARHHDSSFGRLTPISPVQQQVANMSKQEGFAVPAPLDNKTTNASAANFRCRSVSPAVHQKNFSGNMGNSALPSAHHSLLSPFNTPVTPEMLSIFANSQTNLGVSSMVQRSRSVPLNIMMQTEVLPATGLQCNNKNITSVLLNEMDCDRDDGLRGLAINNLPSSYTARMNLTQILESESSLSCGDSMMTSDSTSTCNLQRPEYVMGNQVNEQMLLSASNNHVLSTCSEHQQAQSNLMLTLNQQQQKQMNYGSSSRQLIEQVSELTTGVAGFPCEIRMTSELPGTINDLNALDTNLLFDPNQQQGQYQNTAPEELVTDALFQQITGETTNASGLDWLENKDQTTVGLMG
ncbi:DNA-binding protein RFX7 isoform X1 [Cynoglossus semilaevis]|uniref:DNA-binding protein RFX7 isoform X1 n=1 Tax=Cynoglossus semilaevis TaxID=244447 RepID=UPI000D62634D|nr:DNA-binding protein RFX7 isoform X1 [Cynoglossus semilaevis]